MNAVGVMRGEKRPQILRARAVACRSAFCVSICTFVPVKHANRVPNPMDHMMWVARGEHMRPHIRERRICGRKKVGRARQGAAA
jgi:hypothetical protein